MFSGDQKALLEAPLSRAHVKGRKQGGRNVSYVEGWHVIAEANRIFGFDGWSSSTIEIICVAEKEREIGEAKRPGWGVTYTARVRVIAGEITRDGTGAGHGIDVDLGQAHESAIKEAETDARKRALMTFGNPFGLALYDKEQANVSDEAPDDEAAIEAARVAQAKREVFMDGCKGTIEEIGGDAEKLAAWWRSPRQVEGRNKYGLSQGDREILKALMVAKIPPKEPEHE
jgi:DNA recombination protein Rad52